MKQNTKPSKKRRAFFNLTPSSPKGEGEAKIEANWAYHYLITLKAKK